MNNPLFQPLKAIVVDTETTDSKNPEVVELAWRSYSLDGHEIKEFVGRFSHSQAMSWGALATHHILPCELVGLTPSAHAPGAIPPAEFWVGHNIDFDWRALGAPQQVKRICTMAMCRAIWPKLDSHTLGAMMYFLFGPNEQTRDMVLSAHGAKSDVLMCEMIAERIRSDAGIHTFQQLWEFSEECRIPKIMGFGKYKGESIEAVDKGWANWYVRQEDTDPYLITALKRARKL